MLDHKLPLNKAALEGIWGDSEKTQPFYDAQWEFLAPIVDERHHDYETQMIFPSMSETPIAPNHHGRYGDIFEITIIDGHLKLDQKSIGVMDGIVEGKALRFTRAIRKELPKDRNAEREMEIHSQLDQRNHPNILGLYGSYTYDGRLSLILPIMDYRLSDL